MPAKKHESDNVKVVVRCRPISEKEKEQKCGIAVDVQEVSGQITVRNASAAQGEPPKVFTFDTVFAPNCEQLNVYNTVARPIVDSVLEGYNGTIFAYGQTGTGKTFTMEGIRSVPELRGIIPNSFAHVFGHIAKAKDDKEFLVHVSYLEIYNEDVRDLLGKDQNQRLEVKEHPEHGVYVKDLQKIVMSSADEMDRIMTIGNKNRMTGATNMNATSSRSHAIFSIIIEQTSKGLDGKDHVLRGKLHLVDLAGSERQSKTGATGMRLKEATKINLSLSTLGNVISSLVDGKSTHIPYRNSKLTRLLQDSLGGNSKTVMVANVGPADYNYDETISTLRYANRAKNIKNKAKINEDPKDALIRQFQAEVEELRKQLEDGGGSLSGEETEYETETESEEEEETDPVTGVVTKKKKEKKLKNNEKKSKKGLSPEKMAEIQRQIDKDRKKLEGKVDMAEGEKRKVEEELQSKEQELATAQEEQRLLQEKLAGIEKRIIVGGENLLEKAQEQEKLLEESNKHLEEQAKKHEELRKAIEDKQQERLDIEEKYSSLQEEVAGKTKKLKRVWNMYMSAKSETADLQQEHQREMEGLLENVRQLSREIRLNMLMIDQFIPPEFQEMIERYAHWNEEIGEWQLKCVAYTGNNMRKQTPVPDRDAVEQSSSEIDLNHVYLTYTPESADIPPVSKSSKNKQGKNGKSAKGKKKRREVEMESVLG